MEELWNRSSTDVKQSIIQQADPATARSLCQLDNKSRSICRNRLQAQTKYRVCLDDDNAAVECDQIPMFSKRLFLSVIPPQIKIYPEDAVQLTHEFYSQNYRLPNEGFAVSLRKAKLMNTICAIVRPEFLLTPQGSQLSLPPYADTIIIDGVVRQFSKLLDGTANNFELLVSLHNADGPSRIAMGTFYSHKFRDARRGAIGAGFNTSEASLIYKTEFARRIVNDNFIAEHSKENARQILINPGNSLITMIESIETDLNVFHLSRLLKAIFDIDHYHSAALSVYVDHSTVLEVAL